MREYQSDLTPREEQLEVILRQPRSIQEIARLMRVNVPTAKMWLSRLRKKRSIVTKFRYGSSTYELFHEPS